jgi:hypothetical protein
VVLAGKCQKPTLCPVASSSSCPSFLRSLQIADDLMDRKRKLSTSGGGPALVGSSPAGSGSTISLEQPAKRPRSDDGTLPQLGPYQSFHASLRLNQLHREVADLQRRESKLHDKHSRAARVVATLAGDWNQVFPPSIPR